MQELFVEKELTHWKHILLLKTKPLAQAVHVEPSVEQLPEAQLATLHVQEPPVDEEFAH